MENWLSALGIGGWIVAVIGAISLALQKWLPQKGSLEHALIDQLQEQMDSLTKRVGELEDDARKRETYIRRLERRERAWARHLNAVQIGISNGSIPPMLELPDELLEEL